MRTRKPTIFMFGGQGSQYFQMGRELYEVEPTFRFWMDRGNRIVSMMTNQSMLRAVYDEARPKNQPFKDLLETHPALFVVQYALARLVLEAGIEPDLVLGYSLGESVGAALVGSISFEEGLIAVLRQAKFIAEHCRPAQMTAVFDDISLVATEAGLFSQCQVASINFARHFVIAGLNEDVEAVERHLRARSIGFVRLPVEYGFHSRWMDPVHICSGRILRTVGGPGCIPLISCTTCGEIDRFDNEHLWSVLRKPVRFMEAVHGLERKSGCVFLDLSPSGSLAAFVRHGSSSASSVVAEGMTRFGAERLTLHRAVELIRGASGRKARICIR